VVLANRFGDAAVGAGVELNGTPHAKLPAKVTFLNRQSSVALAVLAAITSLSVAAQAPPAQAGPEVSLHDEPATFRSRVNLVMVPVVVRDRNGRTIGDLHKGDFQLLDSGKPQVISKFSVEKSGAAKAEAAKPAADNAADKAPESTLAVPDRFVIYLFDDVHLSFGDLVQVREAAGKHFDATLQASDRAAIFTTSGQGILDFTDDRQKLHAALLRLRPHPIARSSFTDCPYVPYYVADMADNKHDPMAVDAVTSTAAACLGVSLSDPAGRQAAQSAANSAIFRARSGGEQESRVSLSVLKDAVRRVSAMPGQRIVVLASPGIYAPELQHEKNDIIDRAVRSNVIINSLDARGVYYVDPGGDISTPSQFSVDAAPAMGRYLRESAMVEGDLLAEMASGTGGKLFQNSNDLGHGFQLLAAAPEYVYVLGFAPQNLKLDGKFHNLKVTLKDFKNVNLQARRGYYAPKTVTDPNEAARLEIEEALFSREEVRDFPVQLRMQFFKRDEANAKLSAVAHVDLHQIRFRKADGRNYDNLTVIYGLFDRNGNYISGNKQLVEMRLIDQTLAKTLNSGLTLRSSFDVHPGGYVIRLIVRDAEGQTMAAENGAIEIP
jgi:VWFA-related protein